MKRIIGPLLCTLMLLCMLPTMALAAGATPDYTFKIKADAVDKADVAKSILVQLTNSSVGFSELANELFVDHIAQKTINTKVCKFEYITPAYAAPTIPDVDLGTAVGYTRDYYASLYATAHVSNQTAYDAAMGTAPVDPEVTDITVTATATKTYNIVTLSYKIGTTPVSTTYKEIKSANYSAPVTVVNNTIYVKYMAANVKAIWRGVADYYFPNGYTALSMAPEQLTGDTTISVEKEIDETNVVKRECKVIVIKPHFVFELPPAIRADSEHNKSVDALATYIQNNWKITNDSADYNMANGVAPEFNPGKPNITGYKETSAEYDVTVTFWGQELKGKFTVMPVGSNVPTVSITSDGKFSCSPETIEYSTDEKTWTKITDGTAVPTDLYGKSIWVRTPAAKYTTESDALRLTIKTKREAPKKTLQLEATSYSITIINPDDFKGCMFSLNGISWTSKTTWYDLVRKTDYTVYARYPATATEYASNPVTADITTSEGVNNEIIYSVAKDYSSTYILANGVAEMVTNGSTLRGFYNSTDLKDLTTAIKEHGWKSSTRVTLDVNEVREEGDDREYSATVFSMPKQNSVWRLRVRTPWFTVTRNTETTRVEAYVTNPTSSVYKPNSYYIDLTGRGQQSYYYNSTYSNVFQVVCDGSGPIQIDFPWDFDSRADLSGLRIWYGTSRTQRGTELTYSVVDGNVRFTLPRNGYFSIENLNRTYNTLKFRDSQTNWAYSYIAWAAENNIVAGYDQYTFGPNNDVTRAEFFMLLYRLAGKPSTYGMLRHPYTDVPQGAWYDDALTWVYCTAGLRTDTNMFGPSDPMTRAEVAALLDRCFRYRGTIWEPLVCDDRGEIPTYALNAVDMLYTNRIMVGTDENKFDPEGHLTRAQVVTILYRMATLQYWQ